MSFVRILMAGCVAALLATPSQAQDLTGTLKKIKETGAITIGYRESSVPFSYLDDHQKPVGFAMDICAKIVDAVKTELNLPKLEVKYNPVTSATRIPLIANGTVDLECGSTTNNAAREKQAAFTNTHFLTATRFVSKKTSAIKTLDDLKGKTAVSTSGTTNIKQMNDVNTEKKLGINIIPAKDHAEAFLMVETDRAVAFGMDDILLAGFVAGARDPSLYVISDFTLSKPEPYGIMLRRDDPAFKAVADKATAALYASPEGLALYDKWFTKPINKAGLNLNFPIPSALKKEFAHPSDSPDPSAYAD
jgi:glutamate/aspartate transport system substrate-binding protein